MPLDRPAQRPVRKRTRAWLVLLLALAGCQAVDFTERRELSDPIMDFEGSAAETSFYQKTYYSREGSAGGIGSSGGGGCGCY